MGESFIEIATILLFFLWEKFEATLSLRTSSLKKEVKLSSLFLSFPQKKAEPTVFVPSVLSLKYI
jgi:hypothetical protein